MVFLYKAKYLIFLIIIDVFRCNFEFFRKHIFVPIYFNFWEYFNAIFYFRILGSMIFFNVFHMNIQTYFSIMILR